MGSMQAQGYADMVHEGIVSLDTALAAHLQSNHYPPITTRMVPACKEAIALGNEADATGLDELLDTEIEVVNGRSFTARKLIEDLHLDAFIETTFTPEGGW